MNTNEILTKGKVRTMEEKVLVEGRLCNIKKARGVIWLIGFLVAGVMGVYTVITLSDYLKHDIWKDWMTSTMITFTVITIGLFLAFFIAGCIVYSGLSKILIVVTDKRVYGKAMFGKQVDLPLDSISTLGMGMFSSIAVATSSGKITFWGISNRDEVHKAISGLLQNRQSGNRKEAAAVTHITQQAQSSADELKKYKDLLDSGVISQEEFDAKKKQLLGL